MTDKISLKNHFLVATPFLMDSNFSRAVIYLHEHNEEGALGVIVNKPLSIKLGNVFEHLQFKPTCQKAIESPVFMGGPVGQESGYIVFNKTAQIPCDSSDVLVTTPKKMLQEIAQGSGPEDFLVTLGYSGWGAGQIEEEITRNDWLVAPFNYDILFKVPAEGRWQAAAGLIGIDILNLSSQIGHA